MRNARKRLSHEPPARVTSGGRIFPALFGMLFVFTVLAATYFLPPDLVGFNKSPSGGYNVGLELLFLTAFRILLLTGLLHLVASGGRAVLYPFPALSCCGPQILSTAAEDRRGGAISRFPGGERGHRSIQPGYRILHALHPSLGAVAGNSSFPANVSPLAFTMAEDSCHLGGDGAIAYSVFRYSQWTPFPGLHALALCIGSALIIGAGESGPSLVSYGLSWRPVVFVGLISHSLYCGTGRSLSCMTWAH